jgi:hypothetical protein
LKTALIVFALAFNALPTFSQAINDTLHKNRFSFGGAVGVNILKVKEYNNLTANKISPIIVFGDMNFCYGKPLKYNASIDFGIGSDFNAVHDSPLSGLFLCKYGLSLNYVIGIKHKFFITPWGGWHQALGLFLNSSSIVTQYNFLTAGLDLSIFNPIGKKLVAKHGKIPSLLGIKFYYQFDTRPLQIEKGQENFSTLSNPFSLGGFFIGVYSRNLNLVKKKSK